MASGPASMHPTTLSPQGHGPTREGDLPGFLWLCGQPPGLRRGLKRLALSGGSACRRTVEPCCKGARWAPSACSAGGGGEVVLPPCKARDRLSEGWPPATRSSLRWLALPRRATAYTSWRLAYRDGLNWLRSQPVRRDCASRRERNSAGVPDSMLPECLVCDGVLVSCLGVVDSDSLGSARGGLLTTLAECLQCHSVDGATHGSLAVVEACWSFRC